MGKRIDEGRKFIGEKIEEMHSKLGKNVELSQYIAFVELCTKALQVLDALEARLEEGK